MSFLVIEIEVPGQGIPQLNASVQRPTKSQDAVNACRNLLDAICGGAIDATVQVTSRDVTAAVGTSGSGSQQESYNLR
jgi:hypothetical protein